MPCFTILIADDDDDDFLIIRSAFSDSGYTHKLAHKKSGQELLDHLYALVKNQEALPDMILMDINMPKLCGVKTLELIRKEKTFDAIPVIIHTTTECPGQKNQCLKLGAQAFVTKSCNYTQVLLFANELDVYLNDPGKIPGLKNASPDEKNQY